MPLCKSSKTFLYSFATSLSQMNQIAVIGHPSKVGGADTELDHQIRVWQALDIKVHIIHTGDLDANLKAMNMAKRGCRIHKPRDWKACRGMPVISYCNDQFLANIEPIREHASHVFWVNCMSWLFPDEIKAHKKGMIDWFIYQTDRVFQLNEPKLREINPKFKGAVVKPYFHADDFPYTKERESDRFRFCRISREDADKFHEAQLWVYETMVAPVLKAGVVLGINDQILQKFGALPNWIEGHRVGAIPVQRVYKRAHAFIQMADPGQTENLPRVGFEAMASGSVLCVDNRGGWQQQVVHGQTGFLCRDQREFAYYASRLAFEPGERFTMAESARDHLNSEWGMEAAKKHWSDFFNQALG